MKISIDKARCQGHALCQLAAPSIYLLDDNGYNSMDPFEVSKAEKAEALEGVKACPEQAIIASET